MEPRGFNGHDGDMNDTHQVPPTEEPSPSQPDPSRLRSITDVKRSRSDALLGGVSTGVAKHFDIDPVIVRIGFVVLTLIGGAGIICYVAGWALLPSEDGPSHVAEWFNLDQNEERVRVGGLVAAAVLSLLAVVGDSGWGWGAGFPWWLLPAALLFAIFVVWPQRRRQEAVDAVDTQQVHASGATAPRPRERRSPALLGLTLSILAIALAVTRLVAESRGGVDWTVYVAVALGVVGVGLLISTFFGDGGPLIALGLLLALTLAVGSAVPNLRIGEQLETPTTASVVDTRYEHGLGKLQIDLSDVKDPQALLGRTLHIDSGVGETRVIVPSGLDIDVDATVRAGEIRLFDRKASGTNVDMSSPADSYRHLTIQIHHRLGTIEVIRK